jgi:hypothetical protein
MAPRHTEGPSRASLATRGGSRKGDRKTLEIAPAIRVDWPTAAPAGLRLGARGRTSAVALVLLPAQPMPEPAKHRRGTRLDEERRRMIIALLANGSSRRAAAAMVGCAPSTITRAAARDRQFARQLVEAERNVEVEALRRVREASKHPRHWRAAAWMLGRREPGAMQQMAQWSAKHPLSAHSGAFLLGATAAADGSCDSVQQIPQSKYKVASAAVELTSDAASTWKVQRRPNRRKGSRGVALAIWGDRPSAEGGGPRRHEVKRRPPDTTSPLPPGEGSGVRGRAERAGQPKQSLRPPGLTLTLSRRERGHNGWCPCLNFVPMGRPAEDPCWRFGLICPLRRGAS